MINRTNNNSSVINQNSSNTRQTPSSVEYFGTQPDVVTQQGVISRNSVPSFRAQGQIRQQSDSYHAIQSSRAILQMNSQDKHKLANLTKFISISSRESHQKDLAGVTVSIDKVKLYLVDKLGFTDNEDTMQTAFDLMNIANIESSKAVGTKEWFLHPINNTLDDSNSISQQVKDFITEQLGLKLGDIALKSYDVDNALRGQNSSAIATELCNYFTMQNSYDDGTDIRKDIERTIKICSDITSYEIRDTRDKAISLLTQHRDIFEQEIFRGMIKTLIENCSGLDSSGDLVRHPDEAILLLTQHRDIFEQEIFRGMIKTLIENCSGLDSSGDLVRHPGRAISLLTQYKSIFAEDVFYGLVKTLIENFSGLNSSGDLVRHTDEAILLLTKYGDKFEPDIFRDMVKTLIENFSGLNSSGDLVRHTGRAISLLTQYKSIFAEDVFYGLVKTLIENFSGLNSSGDLVRHPDEAILLLTKYGDKFEPDIFRDMVKTLIENCSGLNSSGNLVRHPAKAISLLTQYKEWLTAQENEFYQQTIIGLFNRDYIFRQNITTLLNNHGENITQEMIIQKYINTNSVDIIDLIRNYVQGAGAHRRINLPPRNDILINGRPLAGIAFEVHNYTNGIEQTALEIVNVILQEAEKPIQNFSIDNLCKKFGFLNGEMKNKCDAALNKILGSPDYKDRLVAALPALATFLNMESSLWEHDAHKNDVNLRWQMWLTQSFFEAGTAYGDEENDTSCVKGIYERLFTGFRTMHPGIDVIFAAKNIVEGYKKNIVNIMKNGVLVQQVIDELKNQNADPTKCSFNNQLKKIYTEKLREEISNQMDTNQKLLTGKLCTLPNTYTFINEYTRNYHKYLIDSSMSEFNPFIGNIEYITSNDNNTPLDEYIKNSISTLR